MNEPTRTQKMDAARARMAELATKFLDRTDADIASMRSGLGRMASGDHTALGDIQHLAHRLVGTGATLGFEGISESAHRVEELAEGLAPNALPDEASRTEIARALDVLAAEFQKQRAVSR